MKTKILLVSVSVLITFQCAYFNTFYNAETAFDSAFRKHSEILEKYPDSLVVAPSAEIESQYDRAIEKSLKMLDVYPRKKKLQDEAYFLMGKAAFYKNDFRASIGYMRELQVQFPSSPLVPESFLYMAKSHILDGNLSVAEEIIMQILTKYPHLDEDHQATLLSVEIAIRRGGRSQAINLLQKIRSSVLDENRQIDILLRMAELHIELKQYEKAYNLLRKAPRIRKFSYLMYRVDRSIYHCYDALDSLPQALELLDEMYRNRSYREYQGEILFNKGITLRKMGRIAEAMALFEKLVESYDLERYTDFKDIRGKAYFELALLHQMKRGDYEKAKEAYSEAQKAEDSFIAQTASKRVQALKKLKKLRNPDSNKTITAEDKYIIGELFQFDLEEPDSAFHQYTEVAQEQPSDTTLRPRALSMAALIARTDLKDTLRSDSLLELVIEEYENTGYARKAQELMDVPVSVITREEEAQRDFRNAEKLFYEEGDTVEAVKKYYNIYKKYSDLEIAPKCLYAAAWHTDTDLEKNRVAMKLYEELCEKYPDSDYCTKNAQPRLAVAEDTLEAIRAAKEEGQGNSGNKESVRPVKKDAESAIRNRSENPASPNRKNGDKSNSETLKSPASAEPDSSGNN
ncbi:MAG: tetratricopeptide repeat protein [Chitinispirillaceae bacterium]